MYVLYAVPIVPFFVASVFSLISFLPVMTSLGRASDTGQFFGQLCFLITMILVAAYIITYIASLSVTMAKKKIFVISFLPLFHIALIVVLYFLASGLQGTYGTPSISI